MKVYAFGNVDVPEDRAALTAAEKLKGMSGVEWVIVKPNEDVPFADEEYVVIMDTMQGIKEVTLFSEDDLDRLAVTRSTTAHDWDLGLQLKYLKKLGKLGQVTIVGVPQTGEIDYERIQSILRKLVEQEMQGS